MSLLAEPRRKQKLSTDPRNLNWKTDEQKVSRKLMEKMGWNEGQGLGRNNQGNSEHLKLKANRGARGLGGDKLADYDSTWISHHDDFADLLKALNENKKSVNAEDKDAEDAEGKAKTLSIELNSKSLKRRIHYQKFTRAKDMTNYSESDKIAVLGLKKAKTEEEKEESPKVEEEEEKEEITEKVEFQEHYLHTVSKVSVGDYFAQKMAALKAKRQMQNTPFTQETTVAVNEELEDEEEKTKREKKERKRQRKLERQKEAESQKDQEEKYQNKIEETVPEAPEQIEESEEERKRRKKEKRKLKKLELENQQIESEPAPEPEMKKKKSKKNQKD